MPLALIDVGTSAGLNLLGDRFRYRYLRDDADPIERGDPHSQLLLECELRGDHLPPLPAAWPALARRVGIDIYPVDVTQPEDALWLRSLIWPDRPDRAVRLEKAIAIAAEAAPELVAGDALDVLPALLEEVPPGVLPCLMNCWTLYQFDRDMLERFEALLVDASHERRLVRLSMEGAGTNHSRIVRFDYERGLATQTPLAISHAHGRQLEWNAGAGASGP